MLAYSPAAMLPQGTQAGGASCTNVRTGCRQSGAGAGKQGEGRPAHACLRDTSDACPCQHQHQTCNASYLLLASPRPCLRVCPPPPPPPAAAASSSSCSVDCVKPPANCWQ